MAKSNAKRTLAAVAAVVLCAVIAAGVYVYPRRAVSSMLNLVPTERMVACVRVRGLASVWRRCSGSAFVKDLREGCVFFPEGGRSGVDRSRKAWEYLDNPYWPEVLGRDCVLAFYSAGDGGILSEAVWSRVGFKTRCFHLWERWRARLCFWREKRLDSRREGRLSVTTVMDLKRRTPRFSYTLIGDLAIATRGSGEAFWKRVDDLMAGRASGARTAVGKGAAEDRPKGGSPGGGFFINVRELREWVDRRLHALPPGGASNRRARLTGFRDGLRMIAGEWDCMQGTFDLKGDRLGTEASIMVGGSGAAKESGGASLRNPSDDPLARLVEQRGLLYAGSRCDLRGLLGRLRSSSGAAAVEFVRREGTTLLPSDHFTFSWLGDDCSLLLYQGENGMVNAAASFLVNDHRLAKERIGRFINLARGARINLLDRNGKRTASLKKPLDIELKRRDGVPYCLVGTGDPVERFYRATVALRGDRLLVATADSFLGELDGGKVPSARGWSAPAGAQFMVRGSAAARAAASLTQVLAILSPFVDREGEREALASARRMLGAVQWLAPVREGWATALREGREIRMRGGVQFADIESR